MLLDGTPLDRSARGLRAFRRRVQLVLQDPSGALNPRHTVYESVAEGIRLHRLDAHDAAGTHRGRAGGRGAVARPACARRSGCSCATRTSCRAASASASSSPAPWRWRPQLLVADEPVSSLDASIRGEILALLLTLREQLGLGVLVVTHDLGLAWNIADRIAVMYLGRIVEAGPTEDVLRDPKHPYTKALLSVVPEIDRVEPVVLTGEVPDPTRIPQGCRFHPRCPAVADGVAAAAAGVAEDPAGAPPLAVVPMSTGHDVACHLVEAQR